MAWEQLQEGPFHLQALPDVDPMTAMVFLPQPPKTMTLALPSSLLVVEVARTTACLQFAVEEVCVVQMEASHDVPAVPAKMVQALWVP